MTAYEMLDSLNKTLREQEQELKGYEALYHRSVGEIYKLRALLKEFIEEENPKDYTIMSERMDELLTKINEVL